MAVTPAAIPVTLPEADTVATPGKLLAQVPPVLPLLLKLINEVAHTAAGPLMVPASGCAFTEIFVDALAVPQVVVTV